MRARNRGWEHHDPKELLDRGQRIDDGSADADDGPDEVSGGAARDRVRATETWVLTSVRWEGES